MQLSKIFSFIFILCFTSTLFLGAEASEATSGYCNDLQTVTWSRTGSTLTIGGGGAMEYTYDIDSTGITNIIIEEGVTEICLYAFQAYEQLERVEFPESLKKIRDYAFWSCPNLAEFELPSNLEYLGSGAFGYSIIDSVTIGEKLTAIHSSTFSHCPNITEIIIPDNITLVDQYAFAECSNLESVTIGENVTHIGDNAFENTRKLKSVRWNAINVEDFRNGNCIFKNSGKDTDGLSVVFGSNVNHIPKSCFFPEVDNFNILNNSYCPKVTSVYIPSSVRTIGENAFGDCRFLTDLTLSDGVRELGEDCFSDIGVETIHIPKSVSKIHRGALHSCVNLTEITIDKENENFCVEDGVLFNKDKTVLVQYPIGNTKTTYTVPESVLYIGELSFTHGRNLVNVYLPEGLKQISNYAFYECNNLSGMTIPESVEVIEYRAFYNCNSITHINLPEKVTIINSSVFYGLESLEEFVIHNKVTKIGDSAFYHCNSLKEMIIPDSVSEIGIHAFTYLTSAEKIILPKHLSSISRYAFSHCSSVREIVIPDEVTEIGVGAFDYCSNLITVTIPESVAFIDNSAFRGTSVCSVLYKGSTGEWVELANTMGSNNEKLTYATKYYGYKEGTPIAGLYHKDGTFILNAINIDNTKNAVFYLAIFDDNHQLLYLLPTDPFQKEVKYFDIDWRYDLTKGYATAMIWDKNTMMPLAIKTTLNYQYKDDNFAENEDIGGSGGETGGDTGTGGGVIGGEVIGGIVADTVVTP